MIMVTMLAVAMTAAGTVKVYPHMMDPRKNPDDARRWVKPPDADTLGRRLHFMGALRDLDPQTWRKDLDEIVGRDGLGDFIWANASILTNPNLEEQVTELKRRGLYLFDIWGYVPEANDPENKRHSANVKRRYGGDFKPKPETLAMFERILGDHWLGMDVGEQDGRYVCTPGYAKLYEPYGVDRIGQYRNFRHHFEAMEREHGNRMAALVSVSYGHYFLKTGCYTSAGAEAAQALPSAQLYYSFLRGAGKQYGVPWFGNASVFSRWGSKGYKIDPSTATSPVPVGPEEGASLALLKKLMYAQIFYNSFAVGFECSHYQYKKVKVEGQGRGDGEMELSPIGRIQKGAADWSAKYGDPGVMHAPVALLFDFHAGWENARHLYSIGDAFRVWGTLPYDLSDHFADGVVSMIYPGYEDAGYYPDERGFNAETPYGDILDCVLSDASAEMLSQYPVVVVASTMPRDDETSETLRRYVANGGHLVLAQGNAKTLFPAGLPKGQVTVLPSEWGVEEKEQCAMPVRFGGEMRYAVEGAEQALPRPHPLTAATRAALDGIFRRQAIFGFERGEGLALVTCRRAKGEYTVCVMNSTWEPRPMKLVAKAGRILGVEELPTPDDVKGERGYAPKAFKGYSAGASTADTIAGGDVRLFRVKLDEAGAVEELPEAVERPNATGSCFVMRGNGGLEDAAIERPTFFRHYDTMLVDWRWFEMRTDEEIVRQANFAKLQGLKVIVDFRSGLNFYPDLRIDTEKSERRTAETLRRMGETLRKAALVGSREAVVSEDRGKDGPKGVAALDDGFRQLLALPEAKGWTFHQCGNVFREYRYNLQEDWHASDPFANACARAERLGTPAFKPAYRVAAELFLQGDAKKVAAEIAAKKPDLVFLAAPGIDRNGRVFSLAKPLSGWTDAAGAEAIRAAVRTAGSRVVYDALYADRNDEFGDLLKK